jgi:hypothetical protein
MQEDSLSMLNQVKGNEVCMEIYFLNLNRISKKCMRSKLKKSLNKLQDDIKSKFELKGMNA